MTRIELDELDRLEKAATPGPWEGVSAVETLSPCLVRRRFLDDKGRRVTQFIAECAGATLPNEENANYIAALRNAAPDLIAELRELRVRCERLQSSLEWIRAEKHSAQKAEEEVRNENYKLRAARSGGGIGV